MNERTDQPSKVSTKEEVRPADEHVVTSDTDFIVGSLQAPETPTPAASDDKSDQTTQAPAASDDNQQQPHKRDRSAERKIGKLTKKLSNLETSRTEDRQQIERLQGEVETLKQSTASASPEPELKDFASPQEYAKAFSKWETGQKAASSKKPADTGTQQGARDPNAHAQHDNPGKIEPDKEVIDFQTRGKKKLGDEFSEALEIQNTAVDTDMADFLVDSDFGPEIYVHLANNQDEARKIFDSGSRRKMAALDALEVKAKAGDLDIEGQVIVETGDKDRTTGDKKTSKLGAQDNDDPNAKPAAKETKAGDPPDTGGTGNAPLKPDPNSESMDDYAARRQRELRQARGFPT